VIGTASRCARSAALIALVVAFPPFAATAPDGTPLVLDRTRNVVLAGRHLSARDALHFAVMQRHGITQILSFDKGFDGLPGIERISA
jgi:predicted nucleic acid-binding protein